MRSKRDLLDESNWHCGSLACCCNNGPVHAEESKLADPHSPDVLCGVCWNVMEKDDNED